MVLFYHKRLLLELNNFLCTWHILILNIILRHSVTKLNRWFQLRKGITLLLFQLVLVREILYETLLWTNITSCLRSYALGLLWSARKSPVGKCLRPRLGRRYRLSGGNCLRLSLCTRLCSSASILQSLLCPSCEAVSRQVTTSCRFSSMAWFSSGNTWWNLVFLASNKMPHPHNWDLWGRVCHKFSYSAFALNFLITKQNLSQSHYPIASKPNQNSTW